MRNAIAFSRMEAALASVDSLKWWRNKPDRSGLKREEEVMTANIDNLFKQLCCEREQ